MVYQSYISMLLFKTWQKHQPQMPKTGASNEYSCAVY